MGFWDYIPPVAVAKKAKEVYDKVNDEEFMYGKDVPIDRADTRMEHGSWMRDRARAGFEQANRRRAPQARGGTVGQVMQGQSTQADQEFRRRQMQQADRLSGIMSGAQQGAGEMAARRQGERAMGQQMGMARMSRGAGAAMGARTAARNISDIGQGVAGQASEAALRDQQMAAGQLGQVLGQGRQGDIQQAGMDQQMNLANMTAENQRIFQQAGLDQSTSLANMQSKLTQMGMNDAAAQAYLAQLMGMDQAELNARMQQDQIRMAGKTDGVMGDLMVAGGTYAAAASDERLKEDIKPGDGKISELLDSINAHDYQYKDEKWGKGRRVSPMAQELEKSELGAALISETMKGEKIVDYGKGLGTMMAVQATLHKRLKKLEGGE